MMNQANKVTIEFEGGTKLVATGPKAAALISWLHRLAEPNSRWGSPRNQRNYLDEALTGAKIIFPDGTERLFNETDRVA